METSPLLVPVPTHSLVMSAGPFSATPGNLSTGPGWDLKDSSEREQIHEEIKNISPPLCSKATEDNNTWQWDPRARYFISPLLWCKTFDKATPFPVSAFMVLPGLVRKRWFIWEGRTLALFSSPHLGMGCSTIPWAAKPTTPPSHPPPEAASHVPRQMWRCVTSSAQTSGSFTGALLCWCPISEALLRAAGCICLAHRAVLEQTHHQEEASTEHQQHSLHLSAVIQINTSWCDVQSRYWESDSCHLTSVSRR